MGSQWPCPHTQLQNFSPGPVPKWQRSPNRKSHLSLTVVLLLLLLLLLLLRLLLTAIATIASNIAIVVTTSTIVATTTQRCKSECKAMHALSAKRVGIRMHCARRRSDNYNSKAKNIAMSTKERQVAHTDGWMNAQQGWTCMKALEGHTLAIRKRSRNQ